MEGARSEKGVAKDWKLKQRKPVRQKKIRGLLERLCEPIALEFDLTGAFLEQPGTSPQIEAPSINDGMSGAGTRPGSSPATSHHLASSGSGAISQAPSA